MTTTNNERETTTMDDYTFTVCQDCIMAIANGDTTSISEDYYDEWSASFDAGMARWSWVSLGRRHGVDYCGRDHDYDDDDVTDCETIDFDTDPCGVCGSRLAGFRFYVTAERASA